jgi:hypothetical protein
MAAHLFSVPTELSRPYASRQVLVGAEATDIALKWVERAREAVEQAKRAQHPQEGIDAHATVTALEPLDGCARDVGSLGELRLGQPAQLAPGCNVISEPALSPEDGTRAFRGSFKRHF